MHDSGLHILLVTSWYPSDQNSSYGVFVEEQAQLLARKGHQVKVLHIGLSGTFAQSLGKKSTVCHEHYQGIEVIRIEIPPVLPVMRGANYRKACRIARKQIKALYAKRPPDVIHSHALFIGGIVAADLSKQFAVPFVHTEHSSALIFTPRDYTAVDIRYLRRVYASAQHVVFVSRFLRDEIQRLYAPECNARVVPNMVQAVFFEVEHNAELPPTKLISIGGLLPVKNFALLLDAMALVSERMPEVTLTIYGEGEQRDLLQQKIERLGLQRNVLIEGRLDRAQILEVMQSAAILVSSSKLETFGLTIAEALACGIPVVATDSGGVRDILSAEVGIISEQNPEALALAIIRICEDYANYAGQHIRAYAKNRFHEEFIYNELLSLYPLR